VNHSTQTAPLAGVRVLEFGHVAAGPFAASLLADLGADVVKIEPGSGDQMRSWPPIAVGPDGERFSHNFASVNRNKRSIAADLKSEPDVSMVRELCAAADVVLENYRPGTLDRLGFGFDALRAGHRGLVYCSISGFGTTGGYRDRGAFDVVIQAMSGLMSVTGPVDGPGVKCGVPVGDFVAGLYAALSVTASLPGVRATGRSVHLDCPMLDSLLAVSALQTSEYWGSGVEPRALGTAHPRNAPYQTFDALDAEFAVAAGNDRLWLQVCAVVDAPELADDPRFADQGGRVRHQIELAGLLQERFRQRPRAEWLAALAAAGVPSGPVNTFGEILADPVVASSGLIQELSIPVAGPTPMVTFPVRFSGERAPVPSAPPVLGADREAVLDSWLSTSDLVRSTEGVS
jgi:succinate---hydroxymethylglutarate CoA-transferase